MSQKGSLVSSKKLRFDYSSNEQLSLEKHKKIENLVNNSIRSNIGVEINQMSLDKALKLGAIALFGEKYPNKVRVVSMKSKFYNERILTSIELCGGTHVKQTGQIGFFKILSDISVSSGVRRIEALTGQDAHDYVDDKINSLHRFDIHALQWETLPLHPSNRKNYDAFLAEIVRPQQCKGLQIL